MNNIDTRPWITIFPDYPRAFAWFRCPCNESSLDSHIGFSCGDLDSRKCRGVIEDNELPIWLTMRFRSWMDKWEKYDQSDSTNANEEIDSEEERAIDDEGIELTHELKKLYGDKYRFRYSFAWRHGPMDWIIV